MPQDNTMPSIQMACADENFAPREFVQVETDEDGRPDYACKTCGWLQKSTAAGAVELLENGFWSDPKARAGFAAKAATFLQPEAGSRPALKVFEVTAAGYDGSTDETDDLVFWVAATSPEAVRLAILDTGSGFSGEVLGWSLSDADFTLPGQAMALSEALLELASKHRNKNRAVA